ncbi:DUF3080 domain-containing protein [Marinobacter sp.]|uniref:DUF3080 domain-containing protein n=1 Tax=Marinobacter sp. TaxID=50741 RepID=UPI00385159DF
MMDEYVERTARVLDVESRFAVAPDIPRLPRRRERQLEMPALDMDVLDFLSLYGCELQFVVGERNSIMGRVMQPLNRLRYEVRFIHAARECLPEISNDSLADRVQSAAESKLDSLPVAIWNATWGVAEIESLFTLSKGFLPVAGSGAVTAALGEDVKRLNGSIEALYTGDLSTDLGFVGRVHQQWQANHRAGQILNSAALVVARLDDVTRLIGQRLDTRPLCFDGKPNRQAEIVNSMFFAVYIGEVQPWLADLQRARNDLMVPLEKLASLQQEVMPESFLDFHREALHQEGGLWQEVDRITAQHIEAWQDLLEQCGMRPSA